jgi:hypothetical protein
VIFAHRNIRSLMLVAIATLVAGTAARANHYILPCDGDCPDPRWVATGSLNGARSGHTATLLQDGRVLIVGGWNEDEPGRFDSAEVYDPADGIWRITGRMSVPRSGHTATLLSDGRVLVAGGGSNNPAPPEVGRTAELYDPATGRWSSPAAWQRFDLGTLR